MARRKLTEEEKLQKFRKERIEREYNDRIRELPLCPEPTYFFNVGDRVAIGCLEDVVVTEVCENGKFYKIQYSVTHQNYGNPYKETGLERYVMWYDLRPINNATESIIQNADVQLYFSPTHLGDILSKAYHFGIDMNPDYQRDYVWSLEDKEKLIESIFHNIDIGKFCFIKNEYTEEKLYEVLDGKQRIRAILDFYENRFPYKGKYFNDLCRRDQDWFCEYHIASATMNRCDKKNILRYFLMLNRGGKAMSEEQLQKVEELKNSL